MGAKVINLKQARKAKARIERRAFADANAVRHGLSKVERLRDTAEKTHSERLLDGHKMNDGDGEAE